MPPAALQRAAHNRLVCIGGVKLAGSTQSFMSTITSTWQ